MKDGHRDGWAAGKRLINPEDVNVTRNQSVRPTAEATSEHFKNTVHNRPEAPSYEEGIEDLLDDLLPEGIADEGAALAAKPDVMEIRRAVMSCSNHKALDSDDICAETFKALASNEGAFRHVVHYVDRFWADLNLIENKQGVIRLASIYKGKGCKRDPGNYRGVSIISIVIKIISKICAKRLGKHFVKVGGDDQHSKVGGGCADGTFTVKLAASLLREHGREAYIAFIDLEKAYDTVNRDLLWKILAKYGVPEGLINVLRKLYANLTIHLKIDGDKRWHFYTSGVKQGGPEASVLFSFFMDAVVRTLEVEWMAEDIDIPHFRWFTDNRGNQLPKGQLIGTDARNKGNRDIDVWRSLYVDDMAVIFTNRQDVDKGMKLSVKHFRRFGLSIHTGTLDEEGNLVKKSKTEILYIPPKHQRKMEYSSFEEQTVDVVIGGGRFMSFVTSSSISGTGSRIISATTLTWTAASTQQ